MTVTLKNKPIVVPDAIRRKAGLRRGDQIEFNVSGRVINIVPKLSPDELQDEREIRDPKVRAAIREGYREFLAGKTRPAGMLQEELEKIAHVQAARKRSVSRRLPRV